MKPLRIYVAGPYTGPTLEKIEENVNRAIDAGIEIFNKGHRRYVPHLTHLVDHRAKEIGKELTWDDYIKWDLARLEVCDALLYLRRVKRR